MDDRVSILLDSFPNIFEGRVPSIGDFEDEFVVINVPFDESSINGNDDIGFLSTDELSADAEYWESDAIPANTPDNPWLWLGELYEGQSNDSLSGRLRLRIKGAFPGSPGGRRSRPDDCAPPPDALAFYLPFHRYPEYWGIYLLNTGAQCLSLAIQMFLRSKGETSLTSAEARTVAIAYLYHHEAYHSAVEGFAIRSELSTRRPLYRTALRTLLTEPWTAGMPHEETLATAYGLRKVRSHLRMPSRKREAALTALKDYLTWCPPEYAAGVEYTDDQRFVALEQQFKERAINKTLRSKLILPPEAWQLGTYLLMPLLQRNRQFSWICDRNDFRTRSKLALHYFRRKDVVRCLAKLAQTQQKSGGRHLHLVREIVSDGLRQERRTQVPSGEIKEGTLGKMLRDLDLNLNVHKFRDECRGIGEALS